MIRMSIRVENLDKLRSNFSKAPTTTLRYLSRATTASIFEVEKQAVDRNFQFKTPRAFRTGYLSLSFGMGRSFSPNGLQGSIGPTANYAPYVYFGTKRGIQSNPYMDRIARAAEPSAIKHFEKAADLIVKALADV